MSNFIYNDEGVLSLMKRYTVKELVHSSSIRRFVTAYKILQNMYSLKQPLENMVTSKEWEKSFWAEKPEGKAVKNIIAGDESFWNDLSYALKTTEPIVNTLRIMAYEKNPEMGFVYGAIDRAKEEIANNLEGNIDAYMEICEAIDKKCNFQLHNHLHAAAYFLNPRFQYSETHSTEPDVMLGLFI